MPSIRIEIGAVPIKSNLEPAAFDIRQSVGKQWMGVMQPHRHFRWTKFVASRGRSQEKNFLFRRRDSLLKKRKQLRQPGATGKNKNTRRYLPARRMDRIQLAAAFRR